jgi:hypothetical protein
MVERGRPAQAAHHRLAQRRARLCHPWCRAGDVGDAGRPQVGARPGPQPHRSRGPGRRSVIRAARLGKDRIEGWTRARSASEALKAETYLYLTRTPPYDQEDRESELLKRTDRLLGQVGDLAGETVGMPNADRPLPDVHDIDSYLRIRVRPQISKYYQPQAAKQQQRLSLFRGLEFTLSVLAVLLGAIAATARLNSVGVWVAVVTTVGAAITAHIAAARYEHLVISYLSTARQLRFLLGGWEGRSDKTPEAVGKLVRDCEDVISHENESWMAAWSRGEDQALPSPAAP